MRVLSRDNGSSATPYKRSETIRAQPTHIACTDTGNSSNRSFLRSHFECSSDVAKSNSLDALDCRDTSDKKTFYKNQSLGKRLLLAKGLYLPRRRGPNIDKEGSMRR